MAWRSGTLEDGSDSMAEEVAPASHWPEMRALILVVSDAKKDVGSTEGMQTTVGTSTLFAERIRSIVPGRMAAIEKSIQDRNFESFADVTMKDSNGFHATCLDSWPPIFYLTDVSRAAIRLVHDLNRAAGRTICAYTFDAGPNAVIYYLEKDSEQVAGTFKDILGASAEGWDGPFADKLKDVSQGVDLGKLDPRAVKAVKEGVNRVILTGVGEGPVKVNEHLVNEKGEILSGVVA